MKAKRRGLILVAAMCLAAGGLHGLSLPAPTGPDEGVGAKGHAVAREMPAATLPPLRIGAFNIRGGKGTDGRRDIERVADCLDGLDFVALNEVHGPRFWQRDNQAQTLGQQLDMQWLFSPATQTWGRFETGNGLLTRVEIGHWQRIPLVRRHDRSYRNALLVEFEHFGQTIRAVVTHVNRNNDDERQTQLREVAALFLALREPAMLLGDLNSTPDDPQIRALLATPGVEDAVGPRWSEAGDVPSPAERIDWIITRGFATRDAGVIDRGASDHPLVWAEVTLDPEPAFSTGHLAND